MLEMVLRAMLGLLRAVGALVMLLHMADKHLTKDNRMGKSPMQEEHHRKMDDFLDSTWFMITIGSLLLGGLTYAF